MMSVSCKGMLMKNLETCMEQRVVTSPTSIEARCNVNLSIVEECVITPLSLIML